MQNEGGGMSMYCRKCGQEIGQEESFCSNCGAKAELVKQPKEPKKKLGMKIGISIGVICLVAVLLGGAGIYYHQKNYHYLAVVRDENGKYGYINEKGKEIIPCRYDNADDFQGNGLAAVAKKTGQDAEGEELFQWGFINCEGEEVIPMQYDAIDPTGFADNGLLAVANMERFDEDGDGIYAWGFINEQGKEVIPCQYYIDGSYTSDYFSERWKDGLIVVTKRNEEGDYVDAVINEQGEEIISFGHEYSEIQAIVDQNLILVKKQIGLDEDEKSEYRYGGINQKNEIVIPFEYEDMGYYTASKVDLIAVSKQVEVDGSSEVRWGIINRNGETTIPFDFSLIHLGRSKELIGVQNEVGEDGCINVNGDLVIPYGKYDLVVPIYDNLIRVTRFNEKHTDDGYVNEQGKEVIPCGKYENFLSQENCILVYDENQKMGIVDFDGNVIMEPKYDEIFDYGDNDWATAGNLTDEYDSEVLDKSRRNKYQFEYIDKNGNVVMELPNTYIYAQSFVKVK